MLILSVTISRAAGAESFFTRCCLKYWSAVGRITVDSVSSPTSLNNLSLIVLIAS